MSGKALRVEFIPWDYESSEHIERMFIQRVSCGWRSEEVHGKWVEQCRAGKKALYWAVLRDDVVDQEKLIAQHMAANPQESTPIHDTAATHWLQPRPTAQHRAFTPIGHIALDLRPEQNASLHLPDQGIVWVAGLFVSTPLQASGLGREVMRLAEAMAAQTPALGAQWIVLDTMTREQQMDAAFIEQVYLAHGRPKPTVPIQVWYEHQGYQAFAKEAAGYKWLDPVTGTFKDIDCLFMRKSLQ